VNQEPISLSSLARENSVVSSTSLKASPSSPSVVQGTDIECDSDPDDKSDAIPSSSSGEFEEIDRFENANGGSSKLYRTGSFNVYAGTPYVEEGTAHASLKEGVKEVSSVSNNCVVSAPVTNYCSLLAVSLEQRGRRERHEVRR
jgi:hypothetical protein